MGEADLFRQYAKEAMHVSSNVKDEDEKQALVDLAFTWALAGLMSDRVLGSSFVSSLCDVGEATSHSLLIGPLRTPNFPLGAARGSAQSRQRDEAARRM
jgi:hypothetical protein